MTPSEINATIDRVLVDMEPHFAAAEGVAHYSDVHVPRYRYDIAQVCKLIPAGSRILDYGAYPYIVSETLARLGYKVVAGDIHPEKCSFASVLSFPIVKADANGPKIDIDDNEFDAIVMTEVFEHLHANPIVTMREILRVLKPGGLLYLTTPNGIGIRKLARLIMRGTFQDVYAQWKDLESTGIMGHVTEYTPREMVEFLTRCGFADVRVATENVYRKKNAAEHHFWRAISVPFPKLRENICCFAKKAPVIGS